MYSMLNLSVISLYLDNTPDLNHEFRECKTLNLYYGTCYNRGTGKHILSAFNCCSESRIHIGHKEYLIHHVFHCYAILCEHVLDVGICLPHLNLHISVTDNIALVVMTHLP